MTPPPPPPRPPWRDAHLHLAEHGQELSCVRLADTASLADCLRRIAAEADRAPCETGWIKATGARAEAWPERRLPRAGELHEAGRGRPVLVVSFDHHAMSVSRRVLEMAGVTRDTPGAYASDAAFGGSTGMVEKDAATGEPTGVFVEAACDIVRAVRPEVSLAERTESIRAAQRDLLRLGVVEVHDMFATADLVRALAGLERAGELELQVRLYAPPAHLEGVIAALADAALRADRVALGGLKLFTDGTLNSRTAFMLRPYAEPPAAHPRGTPFYSDEELLGFMRMVRGRGIGLAAHAIGDAAVRRLLDAWGSLGPADGSTLRVEHAQFVHESDISRFASMGAVASLQPCHLLTDIEAIERLVPDRGDRAFPLRELIDSCARHGLDPRGLIVLGSDTPVVRPDPQNNLIAAVERRRPGMDASRAVGMRQAITREECAALMRPAGP